MQPPLEATADGSIRLVAILKLQQKEEKRRRKTEREEEKKTRATRDIECTGIRKVWERGEGFNWGAW
jgi:hypothetical protein